MLLPDRFAPARRPRRWIVLCLALALSTAATAAPDDTGPQGDVLPGVVVVEFRAGVTPPAGAAKTGVPSFDRIAQAHQVYRIEQAYPWLEAMAAKRALPPSAASVRQIYYLHYGGPQSPRRVAAALARDPAVAWAEPYFRYRIYADAPGAAATPNDPLFVQMAHLRQMRLPEAWDVVKGEAGSVVVALIDGGTDWRHPDLAANVWTNPGEIDDNDSDDDANGFIDDVHGWNFANRSPDPTGLGSQPGNARHGTVVAGTAGAVTDNNEGISGTSWNATFMPINAGCPNDDNLICFGFSGLLYAAANGAQVINTSWGGPERSEQGQRIIDLAVEMGALVVAAAGNDGQDSDLIPSFPANYDGVLPVGSTFKDLDTRASFSNYGRSVGVFAPGRGIDSTVPDGQYSAFSGTSFSAPLIAGVAALVQTRFPAFSPDQVREQIRVTSDPIDDDNPLFRGKMGKGRVNAFRAVTATDIPAIRMTDFSILDSGGNGTIESGETVQLTATFTNYLAEAAGVTVELVSEDAFVTITDATASVGTLASGAEATVTVSFEMAADTPGNRSLLFFLEVSAGTYTDADVVRLVANQTSIATHTSAAQGQTPPLQVSITDEGNIGFLEFSDDSPGIGLITRGRLVLFEGGLLVATGPGNVSDCVRRVTTSPPFQDEDFQLQEGTSLQIISPGALTHEQGLVAFTDETSSTPIGLQIVQESFVDNAPENQDFIILRYTITNTSAGVLSNLFAGLFFDWDVNQSDALRDAARFDEQRQFGYVQDAASDAAARQFVGAHLLAAAAPLTYRAIDNPTEIYGNTPDGGYTQQEKWSFLSNGVQVKTLSDTDVSQQVGSGPYSLDPGASVEVVFALVAGRSQSDLFAHVDAAEALWLRLTDVEEPVPAPRRFALDPVYPNPAVPPATVAFELAAPGNVTLTVYDLLGRAVHTLAAGRHGMGRHTVVWDGTDGAGRRVAGGLYFVRLTATDGAVPLTQSQSVVVLR